MTSPISISTGHEDMIHDAEFDHYGKRVATASSDRVIKIFELAGDAATKVADLKRHEGPVWQVSWAHPRFGSLLASCGYDRRVIVWKEDAQNGWNALHEYTAHTLSVNSVAWAPHEYGLMLACASSDGHVSVLTWKEDDRWDAEKILVDGSGVNAVSWAPSLNADALLRAPAQGAAAAAASSSGAPAVPSAPKRFAVACCDGTVRIYEFAEAEKKWLPKQQLRGHSDWVRDVAWAPCIGMPRSTIASCSQDCTVRIWTLLPGSEEWHSIQLPKFTEVVWRVSWSIGGNTLAVACGDNRISLWKESLDGEWRGVSSLDEPAEQPGSS